MGRTIDRTERTTGAIDCRLKTIERDRHGGRSTIRKMRGMEGVLVGGALGHINVLLKVSRKGCEVVRRE